MEGKSKRHLRRIVSEYFHQTPRVSTAVLHLDAPGPSKLTTSTHSTNISPLELSQDLPIYENGPEVPEEDYFDDMAVLCGTDDETEEE